MADLPVVHVVSTAWRHPTRALCEQSVRSQLEVQAVHHYIEASEQDPPRTKIENLRDAIGKLPPDAIVVLLDGDDWLAHRRALVRVARAHLQDGKWVTWGSFRNSDGSPGFAAPYAKGSDYRQCDWCMTHLKSFRAGLFNAVREADLKYPSDASGNVILKGVSTESRWIDRGDDPAFMWPIAELAGEDRCQFLQDVLYVYCEDQGWHRRASQAELEHQAKLVALSRARPRYARIENLGDETGYR